jgi:hypothetical protein
MLRGFLRSVFGGTGELAAPAVGGEEAGPPDPVTVAVMVITQQAGPSGSMRSAQPSRWPSAASFPSIVPF